MSRLRRAALRNGLGLLSLGALLAGSIDAAVPASEPVDPPVVPAELGDLARRNLERHLERERLAAWRDTCIEAEAEAFDFLFAWLPSADLAAWRAERVIADIELSVRTRRESPWREQIPAALFRTYVLPHRVAQEPIQGWRPRLHEMLWDRVRNLPLRDAALEINRFCREHATFTPTSSRDQGPLTTMKRGVGRCEEEMIFFICAARSVGIPARPCYTPAWMVSDNNHAWVEVFTGDGWHYLGACEPEEVLDKAWFTGPAKRAGLVLSVAYGEGTFPGETVHSRKHGATLINSTEVYTRPGTALIQWADRVAGGTDPRGEGAAAFPGETDDGHPSATRGSVEVTVHVFNWGSLSPLGSFPAGGPILLGPGDYVLTCVVEGRPIAAPLTIHPGETTTLTLDPRPAEEERLTWLQGPFWLRIPTAEEVEAATEAREQRPGTGAPGNEKRNGGIEVAGEGEGVSATSTPDPEPARPAAAGHDLAVVQRDLERERERKVSPEVTARLASLVLSRDEAESDLRKLLEHLGLGEVRMGAWSAFLAATAPDTFPAARDLVLEMDDKDFFEADTAAARTAVREALRVRVARELQTGEPLADSLWNRFVLSPRIDRQAADLGLWTQIPHFPGTTPQDLLARFAARVRETEEARFGPIARPSDTWRSGYATAAAARVGLVGLLRRHGIPARVDAGRRWVEAWSDGDWRPCDPLDADSWDRREGETAEAYAGRARLRATFLQRGHPMAEVEGWRHFRLARFHDGAFEPQWIDYPVHEGVLEMDLEPGDWWLFAGQRDGQGNPRIVARSLKAGPGDTLEVSLEIGIPPGEEAPRDLAPKAFREEFLPGLRGLLANGRPVVVFVWSADSEPSRRTADALTGGLDGLGMLGLQIASVGIGGPAPDGGRTLLAGPDLQLWSSPGDLARVFGGLDLSELPVVALVTPDGRTLYWKTGMQLDVTDQLRRVAQE